MTKSHNSEVDRPPLPEVCTAAVQTPKQPYTRDDLDADIVYLSHLIDVIYDRWTDGMPDKRGFDFHMDSLLLIGRNMARDLIKKTDRTGE